MIIERVWHTYTLQFVNKNSNTNILSNNARKTLYVKSRMKIDKTQNSHSKLT